MGLTRWLYTADRKSIRLEDGALEIKVKSKASVFVKQSGLK